MIDNTALLSELYSIQESYSVIEADIDQTSKRCIIDVKERTINVPKEIESLGVQYDHRSYRLFFEIDRYIHGVDLLTQTCVIQWLSKNGTAERSGLHPIVEIEAIDNDKLLFVWELYEDETRIPGTILFAVNFYTMKDENSFLWSYNTLPASSTIQDTLDVVINPSDEITPSLLMVWNDKMVGIERLAHDSVSTSSRSAHEAEAWAHGRTDFPNTMLDNAKYYKDLTQALYDEAKDALSEEKDRVVEEAKDEIVNLAKDEVIAVVKNEVTDDVINDVYAAKNDSIAAINDTTTSAIQEVEQSKNNAINDLFATGDQRYAVKGSIPTKVSELENDRNYLTEVPDAPVKSVNGKTGDVDLSAEDVGAVASEEFTEFKVNYDNHTHTAADVGAATSEEVSQLMSDLNEEVTARQNAVATETAERKKEIAVERERINQFTALAAGSTTGDAELTDARIDKDGIVHPNVGEHIRNVSRHLSSEIDDLDDKISMCVETIESTNRFNGIFEQNKNMSVDGTISNFDGREVSSPQYLEEGKTYYIHNRDNQALGNCVRTLFYDVNDNVMTEYTVEYVSSFTMPIGAKYARICTANAMHLDFSLTETAEPQEYEEYYRYYQPIERHSDFWGQNEYWKDKKIVWFGTSIPAGVINAGDTSRSSSYPLQIGRMLGATVYNESVGSSAVRGGNHNYISNDDPMGYKGVYATCLLLSLSLSTTEKQAIIDDWDSKWRDIVPTGDTLDMSDTAKERYLSTSWDRKLTKYLSGGEIGQCDLYVFDHAFNDAGYLYNYADLSEIPENETDRTYFIGAMAFIIHKILEDNPCARICFIGHYENQLRPLIAKAQETLANEWSFPLCKTWEKLGWSQKKIMVDGTEKTIMELWCPDKVHPSSDTTGKSLNKIAEVLYPFIRDVR